MDFNAIKKEAKKAGFGGDFGLEGSDEEDHGKASVKPKEKIKESKSDKKV